MQGALVLSRDERTYKNKLDTKKGSRATENYKARHKSLASKQKLKGKQKPPQSCEERKLGCTRHNASLLAVDNLSCCKVFGANYLTFSQSGYIFYVLSMPIESTKIRASEWEQACLHTQRAQLNFVKQRTLRIWSLS